MSKHFRANLWLLTLTVLLCSAVYPLVLWGVGQAMFADKAAGSLIGPADKPVGSRLIAQPFTGDEYFWPRPSAVSYKADASGGSNLGANNPLLRGRVAQQLGPISYYAGGPKKGRPVGPDIEAWFAEKPDRAAKWADDNRALATAWIKSDALVTKYVGQWAADHPEVVAAWKKANPDATDAPKPEDMAGSFFASYAAKNPGTWPSAIEDKKPDGKAEKVVKPVKTGSDIQSVFFDTWLQEHPDADLEKVPADMVMTSGSGLDPHVTLRNAHYQLVHRVAKARLAAESDVPRVRDGIEALLRGQSFTPLGGLAGGEPLVNVLEVNLLLDEKFPKPSAK